MAVYLEEIGLRDLRSRDDDAPIRSIRANIYCFLIRRKGYEGMKERYLRESMDYIVEVVSAFLFF